MIIATSGHVDHGKTSLVRALTGVDTDSLKQEKARGLTIDLGFAYLAKDNQTIGFVDVPGHIRFINNMLAGVSSIDFGLLVIAADDGPMPQTREHLAILALLGITHGCIVLTKIDMVSDERLLSLNKEVDALTANTVFEKMDRFPVSSTTGTGLDKLTDFLWHNAEQLKQRNQDGYFRMAIDRAFSVKGTGLVVTGSIHTGQIHKGQEVILHPQGTKVRIRGIHRQNQTAESGFTGDRCAINISGDLQRQDISRGNWLSVNSDLPLSQVIDVRCSANQHQDIKHWTPVHIHAAAQHVTGRIATLEKPMIGAGTTQMAQLILDEPINICTGDKLIIRDQAAAFTLGGCTVLNPFAIKGGRAKATNLAYLNAINADEFSESIEAMILARPDGATVAQLSAMFNRDIDVPITNTQLHNQNLFHLSHVEKTCEVILAMLETSEQATSAAVFIKSNSLPSKLTSCALASLLEAEKIKMTDGLYQLAKTEIKLPAAEQTLWSKVEPILAEQPLKPPVLTELAKRVNLPLKTVEKLLSNCIPFNIVLRPVKNRFFLPGAIKNLKQSAVALAASKEQGQFTVIEFRDQVGIGRNLCIELLEYFDNTGFTKRLGDRRIIQNPKR